MFFKEPKNKTTTHPPHPRGPNKSLGGWWEGRSPTFGGPLIFWTKHVKKKMRQYGLSENRLRRILWNPERKEVGVAPGTIAIMQSSGTKKHSTEIWLMYQIISQRSKVKSQKLRIISAWRYPGKSPVGKPPPIPEDILEELNKMVI